MKINHGGKKVRRTRGFIDCKTKKTTIFRSDIQKAQEQICAENVVGGGKK